MDVQFTPEEIAFREEVRNFLENDYPPELRGKYSRDEYSKEDFPPLAEDLCKKGLGRPGLAEAIRRHRLDRHAALHLPGRMRAHAETIMPMPPFGMSMLAPVLMAFANEEQKAKHLPRIIVGRRLVVPGLFRAGRRV
jgi:alkylation response protein AidB-like acyl-CoA dehydrogenase